MTIRGVVLSFKPQHRLLEEKLISFLQTCKIPRQLHQIQAQIITYGFEQNEYICPRIIDVCARMKNMIYAHQLFDRITEPNISEWNSMFKGYSENGMAGNVLKLFGKMKRLDVMPNCFTFPIVLKSCIKLNATSVGEEVHCFAIKGGFKANSYVGTTLVEMYSNAGTIGLAYKVFCDMVQRNVVAWTSMINGYIASSDLITAKRLFDLAPERDVVLWNTMVSGYINIGNIAEARKLFDRIPCKDVMSWNTMLNGYANCEDIEACERLFEEMPDRNVFSWNGLIGGYVRNRRYSQVLDGFKRMLVDKAVTPNDATLVSVLSSCARLGALDLGKWVHLYAKNCGYKRNLYVANALIDMYAKCGVIEISLEVFRAMDKNDLISWNAIINGLAVHGHGMDALNLFHEMKESGIKPDGITFIGVLCACTHMGFVQDGLTYYQSMIKDYSIRPQIEHCGCIADLLSRAGLLKEALEFVNKMPMEADAVIWAALLGGSRVHKNLEVAELALEHLIKLEPSNPANFVMISNVYGDLGRWKDVARLKVAMRDTRVKKIPGVSLVEVNDALVEFYSLDERHFQTAEIYKALRGLTKLLRSSGYVPESQDIETSSS